MEASEFIELAEPDRSTTLDAIGDIIGNGYTLDVEPDKDEHIYTDYEIASSNGASIVEKGEIDSTPTM